MGKSNIKIHFIVTLLFISVFSIIAESQIGVFKNFKTPEYDEKTNKLKYILYGDEARTIDTFINMKKVILDYVKDDLEDLGKITENSKIDIYDIKEDSKNVVEFWKGFVYTKMFIKTATAKYDKISRLVDGKDKVFIRSLTMDIDGIGFDADSKSQIINIHKAVQVTLRQDMDSAEGIKKNLKEPPVRITSKHLVSNMEENTCIFTGNVVVDDKDILVYCDKMTLFTEDTSGKIKDESKKKELTRAICVGNVKIIRKKNTDQQENQKSLAGKANYNLKTGIIVLTENPIAYREKDILKGKTLTIWRDNDKVESQDDAYMKIAKVNKKTGSISFLEIESVFMDLNMGKDIAIFKGDVIAEDEKGVTNSDYMEVYFKADDEKIDSDAKMAKKISRIVSKGDVVIVQKDKDLKITNDKAIAGYADYDLELEKIVLTIKPYILKGGDLLKGKKLVLWKNQDRIESFEDAYMEISKDDEQAKGKKFSIVVSDYMDLNLGINRADFVGNVFTEDIKGTIDCKEMRVFFEDKKENIENETRNSKAEGVENRLVQEKPKKGSSSKKEITKVICWDDVRIMKKMTTKLQPQEQAFAGKVVYDLKQEFTVLTEKPIVYQGFDTLKGEQITTWESNGETNKIEVLRNGFMDVKSQNRTAGADNMSYDLTTGIVILKEGSPFITKEEDILKGKHITIWEKDKKAEKIKVVGDCQAYMKKDNRKAYSEFMDYNVKTGIMELQENVKVISENETMLGDHVTLWEKEKEVVKLKSVGNCRLEMFNESTFEIVKDKSKSRSIVTADFMDYYADENLIICKDNVISKDAQGLITAEKMDIKLKNIVKIDEKTKKQKKSKEIETILCVKDVFVVRNLFNAEDKVKGQQRATSERAFYDVKEGSILMTENPVLFRGTESVKGQKITLWKDREDVIVEGQSEANLKVDKK